MSKQKIKGATASKMEVVLGALATLMALSYFSAAPSFIPERKWFAAGLIFLALSVVVRGLEWGQLVKRYRTYEALLAHDPTGSINALASATKSTASEVRQALKMMIERGMTGAMTINEGAECVVGSFSPSVTISPTSSSSGTSTSEQGSADSPQQPDTQPKASNGNTLVECPSCGAKNNLPHNTTALCGHCGAKIESH